MEKHYDNQERTYPTFNRTKMYSRDKEKIECTLGNRDIWFLAGQESRECFVFYFLRRDSRHLFFSDFFTAKFKQLD